MTEWKVIRHQGYSSSNWTDLYVGTDATKAKDVYEENVRVMCRGAIRVLMDGSRVSEFVASDPEDCYEARPSVHHNRTIPT